MLQIASGKLFTGKPAQSNELRGVVYTNLQLYGRETIETAAGRLLPTSNLSDSKTAVYELTELIEDPPVPGGVASHGVDPYLSDFAAIVSFALNVTCTADSELTRRLTGGQHNSVATVPPANLVRRVFDGRVWCQDEDAERLVKVVEDLIGLQRKNYLAAMRAIRNYVRGLHRLADDPELTYTLLVASLESLAQGFKAPMPDWEDYPEDKRRRIDDALGQADDQTKNQVRTTLLEIEHVALTRRFCDFVLDHIHPSYFRGDAAGLENPIGLSDLPGALKQAYDLRSKHVHVLKELPKLLTAGFHHGETFSVDRVTMLTFQGMTRLARHVITEFIKRQPKVATEVYDYRRERAGIIEVAPAPKYWIGRSEGLVVSSGRDRLEGFLVQIAAGLQQGAYAGVTDLRDVLSQVEELLPNMSEIHRRTFLALYVLFNKLAVPEMRMAGLENVLSRYQSEIERPSVETMLSHLLLGTEPEWSLEEHQTIRDTYLRDQGKRDCLRMPPAFKAGLSLALAERYRLDGNTERARDLISAAVENNPGNTALCQMEQSFDTRQAIPWRIGVPLLRPAQGSVTDRLSAGRAIFASDVSGHG
jgi:hypothetical protein